VPAFFRPPCLIGNKGPESLIRENAVQANDFQDDRIPRRKAEVESRLTMAEDESEMTPKRVADSINQWISLTLFFAESSRFLAKRILNRIGQSGSFRHAPKTTNLREARNVLRIR
jgi:hypothetical protein